MHFQKSLINAAHIDRILDKNITYSAQFINILFAPIWWKIVLKSWNTLIVNAGS